MIKLKKIQGVWAVCDDHGGIIEAYDTKYEAAEAYEPYRVAECLKAFDQRRNWVSLWDQENPR